MIRARALNCTKTELTALQLTAMAFVDRSVVIEEPETVDWQAVFEELKIQAATAVVIDVLSEYEQYIPQEIFYQWFQYSMQVINIGHRILFAQSKLNELFEQNGIPLATLKGAAAACYYPNPSYRNMGDIDFLVEERDFETAVGLMQNNGYHLTYPMDHVDYHVTFDKDGVVFELHKEPAGIAHNQYGDVLRDLYREAPARAIKESILEYEFFRMPRLENGMVLLLHIVKHLDGGLGIRQLCDWMAFVQKELTDEVYRTEFQPLLKKTGLEKMACIAAKTCCLYLGLTGITWCMDADETACMEFMHFALNNGNFGYKDPSSNRAGAVLGKANYGDKRPFLIRAISNLQKSGMRNWEAVKRHPFLKYIAWAYIPCRYIGRIITGKRSLSDTKRLAKTINSDKSLKDKLAVFE